MTTPAEALLAILREEGVTTIFGNPGTSELPFLDALGQAPDIEYVLGVHEGPLVAMADGYARATGRPAFVSLHIAAGLANGLVGLLNARRSRTPLVVMAGQQDRRHLAQDPMLSGDLLAISAAGVKESFDVQHAWDLPIMARRAFAAAVRAPAGPVFLSVPMDLLAENTDVEVPVRTAVPEPGAALGIRRAAALLAQARRPALVVGDGIGRSGSVAEAVALAETIGADVWHQPLHDGIDFPMSHPLHHGSLDPVNAAIRSTLGGYDAIVIIGTHAFLAHHYSPGAAIDSPIPVIQIDDDATELGRNIPLHTALFGGLAATMTALTKALGDATDGASERIAAAAVRTETTRVAVRARAAEVSSNMPMAPRAACLALVDALPDDIVLVEEAITTGVVLRPLLGLDKPGSLRHTVGGGLGSGIGMAIGTRLGDPSRPVVAVLGDGCTLFGLQGLWTAARRRVDVTFVVMNNAEYRTLKKTLDGWHREGAPAEDYLGLDLHLDNDEVLDFTTAAKFFGVEATRVDEPAELTAALRVGISYPGPYLIDARIAGHRDHIGQE
ncbi:thiamine pyrophosphate-binding protein [Nocardia sp. NPDC060249]|uniref:thiamine pyrophosphate-binding protein n=1 Tax=Nocardia sp. NPDC060249 TaxID=3347082 RepID=UPI0036572C8A